MNKSSAYNQRQYKLILEFIAAYKAGQISLEKLITNLEGLIECLENVPDDWRRVLLQYWGDLEIIYAVNLDREIATLKEEQITDINDALTEIKELIISALETVSNSD